jgi:transposase
MARRHFSREFKLEAVRLVREQGMTAGARDLGIHDNVNVLMRWVNRSEDDPQHAFPGHGSMQPEQEDIARLKRELKKVKPERDILQKRHTSPRSPYEVWLLICTPE